MRRVSALAAVAAAIAVWAPVAAQQRPAAPRRGPRRQDDSIRAASSRRADEGKGRTARSVIRGAMLIDGTGGPPRGPVDIVVEGNKIAAVRSAGTPGLPLRANRAPQGAEHEVDATGMYVMPGFVDLHVHAGGAPKNADAEYAYKLWLAHGVTTVRGVPLAGQRVHRQREGAQREERDRRAAHLQLSAAGIGMERRRRRHTREGARVGALGEEQRHRRPEGRRAAARDHGGAARRSEEARDGIDRASRSGRRGADERDQGGAARAGHRHALLRPLRVAAEGLRRPALPGRTELERRVHALRPGGAPLGQDPRAGRSRVEGVPGRST